MTFRNPILGPTQTFETPRFWTPLAADPNAPTLGATGAGVAPTYVIKAGMPALSFAPGGGVGTAAAGWFGAAPLLSPDGPDRVTRLTFWTWLGADVPNAPLMMIGWHTAIGGIPVIGVGFQGAPGATRTVALCMGISAPGKAVPVIQGWNYVQLDLTRDRLRVELNRDAGTRQERTYASVGAPALLDNCVDNTGLWAEVACGVGPPSYYLSSLGVQWIDGLAA